MHAQPGALVYAAPGAAPQRHPLLNADHDWEPSGDVPVTHLHHEIEHPVLHYAGYIGRVGVLAAALGVGAAVAGNTGIALAEPADAGSTTSSSTTESSESATPRSRPTRTPSTRADRGQDTDATRPAPRGTRTSRVTPGSATAANETRRQDAPAIPRALRPQLQQPTARVTLPTVTPATAVGAETPVVPAIPATPATPVIPAPVVPATTQDTPNLPAQQVPSPARNAITRGARAVLAPTATPQLQSSVEWGVFAWVRRTFFNSTPTLAYNPATTSQVDETITGTVTVTDPDGDAVKVTAATPTNGGTVAIDNTGNFTYTASQALAETGGTDTFTVTVADTGTHIHGLPGLINLLTFGLVGNPGHSATTTVTVAVAPVNAAPVPGDPAYTLGEVDHTTGLTPGQLNVTDPDDDTLTYSVAGGPTQGTVNLDTTSGSFTYTPNLQDRHEASAETPNPADLSDAFIVTVDDGQGGTVNVPVNVAIDPYNKNPMVTVNNVTDPDADAHVTVTVTTIDEDGDDVTYLVVNDPAHGTVTYDPTVGTFVYTATDDTARHEAAGTVDLDFDTFTVAVDDAHGGTASTDVTVQIAPLNTAPVAADDSYTVDEDTPLTVTASPNGLLANDSDADNDILVVTTYSQPAHGAVYVADDGSFTYTPESDFNGADSFTYQAFDAHGGTSNTATVNITVTPVNDAPTAGGMTLITQEDASPAPTFNLPVGAHDAEGDALMLGTYTEPQHGTIDVNTATGAVTYRPNANYFGPDFFDYTVSDGTAESEPARVNIYVNPVNDAPVAVNDVLSVDEDTSGVVNVLANDTDIDSPTLTVTSFTQPQHGTVTSAGAGSFTYTPNPDFDAADFFTYTVTDGAASTTGTVTVFVKPVNDAPVANGDATITDEDTPVVINALANDTDVDNDALTIDSVTQPTSGGTVTVNPNGTFTYAPAANFNGTDTFSYTVSDGVLSSDPATVTVNVTPVNDAPVAVDDVVYMLEDHTFSGNVLDNDGDVDSTNLTVTLEPIGGVLGPVNGTLTLNPDGSFTYTPNADLGPGWDRFLYSVSDGEKSSFARVGIAIGAVNDQPVAHPDTATTAEDTPVVINAMQNDTDVEHDPLTIGTVTQPTSGGTVTVSPDGTFTYAPAADFNGTDAFTYTVTDGALESNVATVTVTVTPVNDAPVAVDDTATTAEDTPVVINALANDADVDNTTLTVASYTQPGNGTVGLNTDGTFTYTPNPNYNGADAFTYTATDGTATSNPALVTINVTAVNDAPSALGDATTTAEDTPVVINALANDTDLDNTTLNVANYTQPGHGSVTFTNGSFTYTPEANYSGTDTFTYTAGDGTMTSNEATVTITVTPVNDAPVAVADTYTVDEDTALIVPAPGVKANDTDVDSGPYLNVYLDSAPTAHGTLVSTGGGGFTYTPNADFSGTDSFTYTIRDDYGAPSTATVTITVTPVNDAPVIGTVTSATGIGNTWTVNVHTTDVDAGDAVAVTVVPTDAQHVTVTNAGGGNYSVTVTDTAWAQANPGAQLGAVITATDNHSAPVSTTMAVGTVNNAAAVGYNASGQGNIPALPAGVIYTQIDGGANHTVLLRSDGTAVATGLNSSGQTNIPPLTGGLTYTQVAAGGDHTVLLRSDGQAIAIGDTSYGLTAIPALPNGMTYTQVAAGANHTVLLRSDGTAVAIGSPVSGQTAVPALTGGLTYTQAVAGDAHTVLLRSDGSVVAFGDNSFGQLTVPALPTGMTYTQVAAGGYNTVLLRSDGTAVAVGWNGYGQRTIPPLTGGLTYTGIAVGDAHVVLLRSDGTVVASGWGDYGQTTIPAPPAGTAYAQIAAGSSNTILLRGVTSGRPITVADAVSTSEDTPVVISKATLLSNDTDPDGQALRIISVSQAAHGNTSLAPGGGSITYTPSANYFGTDTFSYTVTDGGLAQATTVNITVAPVNDAPVINAVTSTPGTGNTWTVAVTATDVDSPPASIAVTSSDPNVTVVDSGNGTFTVTAGTAWAIGHPGTQVLLDVTATDATNATDTRTNHAVGTINNAAAVGLSGGQQLAIPALPAGVTYTQAAGGMAHTVLLRSDGQVVGVGGNGNGQISIPALPAGVTYTQVAACFYNTVLLRSDGTAVAIGYASNFQVPAPPQGLTYTQVASGADHSVLLLSNGQAIAVGSNTWGQRNIPNGTYTQIAAGGQHTVLLRSDGTVVAVGHNDQGQATVPVLPNGMTYTQVAAGGAHTVLLRSDGQALAFGSGQMGQTNIPALPNGMTYVGVSAGDNNTVLLRSDGQAITLGQTQSAHPPVLPTGIIYTGSGEGTYHAIYLSAVNTPPAVTVAVSGLNPSTGNVTVTVSAADPNGGPVTLSNTTPAQGAVTVVDNHNGTWTYTYDPTDAARLRAGVSAGSDADAFAITATDGAGGSTTTPVGAVPITPANIAVTGSTQAIALGPVDVAANPNPAIPHVYLANQNTHSVPVTTTISNGLVVTMVVPYPSYAIAVSPDGSRVFVTNHDLNGFVTVRDAGTFSQIAVIPVSSGAASPNGVTVSADSTRAYVSLAEKKGGVGQVAVIDIGTNSVLTTVTVGVGPQGMAASPTRLYVANSGSDTVSVIDVGTNGKITDITVGDQPSSVAVNRDGTRAYVTNNAGNTVSVIDTASNAVIATVDVGEFPNDVSVSPDGSLVYVTNMSGGSVSVIDASTNSVIADVPISGSPMAVGVTPTGNVYVGIPNVPMSVLSLVTQSGA